MFTFDNEMFTNQISYDAIAIQKRFKLLDCRFRHTNNKLIFPKTKINVKILMAEPIYKIKRYQIS